MPHILGKSRIFIEHYYNGFSAPVQLTILPLNAKIPPVPLSLSLDGSWEIEYAGMAELADALDLGSSGQPCGFDPHYPYQLINNSN